MAPTRRASSNANRSSKGSSAGQRTDESRSSSNGRSSASSRPSAGRRASSRGRSSPGTGRSSDGRSSRSTQRYDKGLPDYSLVDPHDIDEAVDVYVDAPVVKVDEIKFELDDFRAHLAVLAEAGHFVQLNAGVGVRLGKVELDIQGVETQALMEVRLPNVTRVLGRVLTTLDRNPELLKSVGDALGDVGGGAHELLTDTGETIKSAGKGAQSAVADVGHGAGQGVAGIGRGAEQGVAGLGQGAQQGAQALGQGAQQGVEGAGQGSEQALQGLGQGGQQQPSGPQAQQQGGESQEGG
jgi:hypothetical protein